MTKRIRPRAGEQKKTAVGAAAVNKTMVFCGNRKLLEPILPPSSEIQGLTPEEFQEWVRVIRPTLYQRLADRDPLMALKKRIIVVLARESTDEEKELAVSKAIQDSGIHFKHPYL